MLVLWINVINEKYTTTWLCSTIILNCAISYSCTIFQQFMKFSLWHVHAPWVSWILCKWTVHYNFTREWGHGFILFYFSIFQSCPSCLQMNYSLCNEALSQSLGSESSLDEEQNVRTPITDALHPSHSQHSPVGSVDGTSQRQSAQKSYGAVEWNACLLVCVCVCVCLCICTCMCAW